MVQQWFSVTSALVLLLFSSHTDAPRSTIITLFPAGEVSEDGSVTLTCSSDAAPPVESFAWFKGTTRLFSDPPPPPPPPLVGSAHVTGIYSLKVKCTHPLQISTPPLLIMRSADMDSGSIPDSFRPQLHLSRLRYTDRGQYFCVARNSLGTDRSGPFLLNVTCESVSCF